MNFVELTDRDGDALTITSDAAGTWITCSSGDDEVTVGPFPAAELRTTLSDIRLAGTPASWDAAPHAWLFRTDDYTDARTPSPISVVCPEVTCSASSS